MLLVLWLLLLQPEQEQEQGPAPSQAQLVGVLLTARETQREQVKQRVHQAVSFRVQEQQAWLEQRETVRFCPRLLLWRLWAR